MSQYNSRCPLELGRRLQGVVNLHGVVATASKVANLIVAEMLDQLQQLGVTTEEILADIFARFDAVLLELAVNDFCQCFFQQSGFVGFKKGVPFGPPDNFNNVPTGSSEKTFQFLNDLAVAAYRPVKSLQVAVHNPRDIVEFLTSRHRDGTARFRFIDFTVTDERPDS